MEERKTSIQIPNACHNCSSHPVDAILYPDIHIWPVSFILHTTFHELQFLSIKFFLLGNISFILQSIITQKTSMPKLSEL